MADAVRAPGRGVWGVVYQVSRKDLAALDRHEGHPWAYWRRLMSVLLPTGRGRLRAWCYFVWEREGEGVPGAEYLSTILRGALVHGLPGAYIRRLKSLGSATRFYPAPEISPYHARRKQRISEKRRGYVTGNNQNNRG